MDNIDQNYADYLAEQESNRNYRPAKWITLICVIVYVQLKYKFVACHDRHQGYWAIDMIVIMPMLICFTMSAFSFLEARFSWMKWVSGSIWAAIGVTAFAFYLSMTFGSHTAAMLLQHPSWYFDTDEATNMLPCDDFRYLALCLLVFTIGSVISTTSYKLRRK